MKRKFLENGRAVGWALWIAGAAANFLGYTDASAFFFLVGLLSYYAGIVDDKFDKLHERLQKSEDRILQIKGRLDRLTEQ